MTKEEVLRLMPFAHPYRFIDELIEIDENGLSAAYTFRTDEFFYAGHFPGRPVTPGAIIGEAAAQAVLALGIYLLSEDTIAKQPVFFLSNSELRFKKVVLPGEKIITTVRKEYFRFGKLKATILMTGENKKIICRGTIAGLIPLNQDEKRK